MRHYAALAARTVTAVWLATFAASALVGLVYPLAAVGLALCMVTVPVVALTTILGVCL